jgi:hypothetical protein
MGDIRLGVRKEEITHVMQAATFHPSKDEWYVVGTSEGQPCLAVFTDGVCTDIRVYKTREKALHKFIDQYVMVK